MKKRRITIIIEEIGEDGKVENVLTQIVREQEVEYANFRQCVNYLIQLFYKTDKKYFCTRTKIGKLLSILAFRYACKGIILFEQPIYRYPECGTLIKETSFLPTDIYVHYIPMADAKKVISVDELNDEADYHEAFKNVDGLLDEFKLAIEDVFYNFGAYSTSDLSELLNPIVEYDGICKDNGTINLYAIVCLDKNQFVDNKVVDYLFKS